MIDVQQGDILDWTATYDGEPFHALLCDPPYHLGEQRWSFNGESVDPRTGRVRSNRRQVDKGFMGKTWDGGDIAFRPETWAALAQHLYPGAWGMAFASSKGWHRMACAIEDAGLIIHPTIFLWVYGSGFPKATRIDTQLKERGLIDQARGWEGHRYGGQCMKPAAEPVVVFQKPYSQAPVDDMLATGAGALWIDGGRIIHNEPPQTTIRNAPRYSGITMNNGRRGGQKSSISSAEPSGRWPANFVPQHLPACNGTCATGCPVARLGEMSGESVSKTSQRGEVKVFSDQTRGAVGWEGESTERGHNDTGTAARFFLNPSWMLERLELSDPVGYYAKASQAEREAGLDPVQVRLMQELCGDDLIEFAEEAINDGRAKPIDNPYQRGETERRNTHPTIKSLELTRWLASLLLPPAPYAPRRLLVPFAGAASEVIGAMLAGWEVVSGIELEAQHVAIAQARIRYWQSLKHRFLAGQPIEVKIDRKGARPPMFDLLDNL